jgi:ABC-type uncharacterized transport system involved in gliding motility auxiliary subunit
VARPALTARGQALRIALAVPALIGIFLLGQAILNAHAWRIDLTPERRYTLSERARAVLDALDQDVHVLAFLRDQDPRNPRIQDLLRQLRAESPHVRVDVVDVNRSPALAREYGVDVYGAIVVESDGRRRVLDTPREEMLVAAVLQVTRQQRKTVAWVVGHGEGDLASTEHRSGYASARAYLEQEYYDVEPVSLLGDGVPVGTAVVVIAGPTKDFLPEELDALDRYLQRPGNALVMLDPGACPTLAKLLGRYGLQTADDLVIDPSARLAGGEYLTIQVRPTPTLHPIVAPLTAPPLFSLARSITPAASGEGTSAAALLESSPESWATTDRTVLATGSPTFVAGRDRRGPIPVGAEAVFATPTPPGAPRAAGRIVAYGNAEFANNFFVELLGNKDLFVNTVAWLARDPQAIGVRSRMQRPGVNQFFVAAEQSDRMFWALAVGLPAALAVVGVALAARRRWG